ncbi:hypothetical protein ACFQY5_40655 [Paeniroseomonas aquatica]|uniref:hypothetical protein n=1 Tax=Paeniroseomonas aquatica TaxID=373043 RepID=UPI003610DA8C
MAEFLSGYEINSWGGVLGPAGIPPALVERIAVVAREAVEGADVRRQFEEKGASVWWTTPEGLAEFRRENEVRFALGPRVRRSSGVAPCDAFVDWLQLSPGPKLRPRLTQAGLRNRALRCSGIQLHDPMDAGNPGACFLSRLHNDAVHISDKFPPLHARSMAAAMFITSRTSVRTLAVQLPPVSSSIPR